MRKTYSLSQQTIQVINGSSTTVAEEFGCEPSYIHQILGQSVTDPFAKFEWLFASCVKAGLDVSPWLNRLEAIVAKYRSINTRSPFECLADKISGDAVTTKKIVKSLEDGAISDKEIGQIQTAIRAERRVLNELEMGLFRVMKEAA